MTGYPKCNSRLYDEDEPAVKAKIFQLSAQAHSISRIARNYSTRQYLAHDSIRPNLGFYSFITKACQFHTVFFRYNILP